MRRYKVQLFNDDNLLNAIVTTYCDNIIQALDRFTDLCDAGRIDYNLDEYYVWLYDTQGERNIIYYEYLNDEKYGTYEELVPCQY